MPLHKDLHLTAEVLSLLRAGFFGQILFEGAVARLNCSVLPEGYVDIAHKAFDKLEVWSKDLLNNLPIFSVSWTQPETFDAISAFNFLRDLKRDLSWLIPRLDKALSEPELWSARDSVKILAAGILRSAAVRNSYVETLANTFIALGAPEYAQNVSVELVGSRQYLRVANIIVDTFATGAVYDSTMCENLRQEASLTPSDFLSVIHDINILINVYAKDFTFELAEIPAQEAEPWAQQKIPAVAAGYWRAYGFSPQDYTQWSSLGISGAPLAALWRKARFAPDDAIVWIREGLPPALASSWRLAGFSPERAGALVRRGISDPSRAPKGDYETE